MRRARLPRAASAAAAAAPAETGACRRPHVLPGDDVFVAETWRELGGRTIGIVTNQSGVLSDGTTLVDAVRANPQIRVKALFAPEHGLRGDRDAGTYVPSYTDERTGLPVYSLYGATRHPSARHARRHRRAGVRHSRRRCAAVHVRVDAGVRDGIGAAVRQEIWVLDRPNPIGGVRVEGPVLDPAYKSFIGLYPIPERHGLTIGELAQLFNGHFAHRREAARRRDARLVARDAVGRHEPALDADFTQRALRVHAAGLSRDRAHRRGRRQQRRRHRSAVRVRRRLRLQCRGVRARVDRARHSRARASSRSTGCRSAASGPAKRWPACRSTSTTRTRSPTCARPSSCSPRRARKAGCTSPRPPTSTATGAPTPCASRCRTGRHPTTIVASWESGLTVYRAIRERYLLY